MAAMKIPEKICLFCKRFYFSTGDYGYSDMTPGYEATLTCLKNHWDVDNYLDTTTVYREKLLTAKSCKDWDLLDDFEEE